MTISLSSATASFPPLSSSSYFVDPQLSWQQAPLSAIDEEDELDAPSQLSSALSAPILPPEICVHKNNGTYALTLLRRAYAENMVFSGGGARNVVVAPALMQMSESSWAGLKRFSGVSGGAINATLMASGRTPKELDVLLDKTPLEEFKKDVPNFESMYPANLVALNPEKPGSTWLSKISYWVRMALFKLFAGDVANSAQRALQLIDQLSTTSVVKEGFVASADGKLELAPALKAKFGSLREGLNAEAREKFDKQLARLKDLAQQSDEKSFQENRTGKMVTFADLAFLHQLAPSKFKELTVAGLDRETSKTVYFNASDYPDMPIAIATYISMALPMYFQSIEYAYPGKAKHIYIDGGMIHRVPVEEFWQGVPDESEVRARTIVLDFLDSGTLYPLQHTSPTTEDKSLKTRLKSWLYNVPEMAIGKVEDRRKLYQAGPNLYALDNSHLRTFPSNMSQKQQIAVKKQAVDAMQEQLARHADEAFATSVASPLQAFNLLSPDEREARRIAGPPTPPSEELGRSNKFAQKNFEATQALYELCVKAHEGALSGETEGQNLKATVVNFA